MPNILKVSKEEISWQLTGCSINAGPQANTRVKEYLATDATLFAPMSVTSNGYIWTSPESGWIPLSQADEIQKAKISAEVASLRQRVQGKLSNNPKLANAILSLPSDEGKYIFFKEGNGQLRILIAGWGFSNSRKAVFTTGKVVTPKPSIAAAKLGFAIHGELQPNYEFFITTVGGGQKQCFTGNDGYYFLGEQKIGTSLQVTDQLSGKQFSLEIEENKGEYVLDITRTMMIRVTIEKDGSPVPDADLTLTYHGKQYQLGTDGNGVAAVSVPYFKDETITANYDDQLATAQSQFPETKLEFKLTSPVVEEKKEVVVPPPPPPPFEEKAGLTIRVVDQFGGVVPDYPISVTTDNGSRDLLTDANGTVSLQDLRVGSVVTVKDGFSSTKPLVYRLNKGNNTIEYFVEKKIATLVNSLQIIGENGMPYANQKVILRQGEKSLILPLDIAGRTTFNADEFENDKEITAQILSKDQQTPRIPFVTDSDEREYIIEENSVAKRPWWNIFLNIILAILLVVAMVWLGAYFVSHLPFE